MTIESGLSFRAISSCTYQAGTVLELVVISYAVIQNISIIVLPFSDVICSSTYSMVVSLMHEMFFHAVSLVFSMK